MTGASRRAFTVLRRGTVRRRPRAGSSRGPHPRRRRPDGRTGRTAGVGFEPTRPPRRGLAVFKTAPFGRSGIPPGGSNPNDRPERIVPGTRRGTSRGTSARAGGRTGDYPTTALLLAARSPDSGRDVRSRPDPRDRAAGRAPRLGRAVRRARPGRRCWSRSPACSSGSPMNATHAASPGWRCLRTRRRRCSACRATCSASASASRRRARARFNSQLHECPTARLTYRTSLRGGPLPPCAA